VDNLLGRTVVVTDIDAAIAMSRKYSSRFKIVTQDGQVMNAGGSMTGGSTNKDAGILSRANELEKLTKQEKKLQQEAMLLDTDLREAQRLTDEVEFQLTTAREQLREAEDRVLRLEGLEKQHEILLEAVEQAEEACCRERDSLKTRQNTDRERYAAQRAKLQVFSTQLAETRQALAELEGSETEASRMLEEITGRATVLKTEEAALEACGVGIRAKQYSVSSAPLIAVLNNSVARACNTRGIHPEITVGPPLDKISDVILRAEMRIYHLDLGELVSHSHHSLCPTALVMYQNYSAMP
jgi:chromosome segregation protein